MTGVQTCALPISGHPPDTPITPRQPTRLLRDMDRLAQQVATAQEAAADRIRQLPATARAAAMDQARVTVAVAQPRLTRRRAPRAVAAAEEAVEADRTPPVAVAIPVVVVADIPPVVAADTAEADIDNSV